MARKARYAPSASTIGLLAATIGVAIIVFGHAIAYGWHWTNLVSDLYANVGTDFIGLAIVILIVDRLAERRNEAQTRNQLIREMSSSDHGLAASAVSELAMRGWLEDGTLAGARLTGADLSFADLEKADLTRADLAGANLRNANLSRARLCEANLSGAQMNRVNLEMADLTKAVLAESQLNDADMGKSVLVEANLASAVLSHADLSASTLAGADLTEAILTSANLRGANLTGARLERSVLGDVQFDSDTQWPPNYRPMIPQLGITSHLVIQENPCSIYSSPMTARTKAPLNEDWPCAPSTSHWGTRWSPKAKCSSARQCSMTAAT